MHFIPWLKVAGAASSEGLYRMSSNQSHEGDHSPSLEHGHKRICRSQSESYGTATLAKVGCRLDCYFPVTPEPALYGFWVGEFSSRLRENPFVSIELYENNAHVTDYGHCWIFTMTFCTRFSLKGNCEQKNIRSVEIRRYEKPTLARKNKQDEQLQNSGSILVDKCIAQSFWHIMTKYIWTRSVKWSWIKFLWSKGSEENLLLPLVKLGRGRTTLERILCAKTPFKIFKNSVQIPTIHEFANYLPSAWVCQTYGASVLFISNPSTVAKIWFQDSITIQQTNKWSLHPWKGILGNFIQKWFQ